MSWCQNNFSITNIFSSQPLKISSLEWPQDRHERQHFSNNISSPFSYELLQWYKRNALLLYLGVSEGEVHALTPHQHWQSEAHDGGGRQTHTHHHHKTQDAHTKPPWTHISLEPCQINTWLIFNSLFIYLYNDTA